ncbi:MAG: stage 0 sporulation family protein [Firmicutes bacterium]|nr:stage 0 sporulation family protein [Bacillota bacterium]
METESEKTAAQEESSETEVVGVHFKKSGKLYYFDPSGLKIERDAHVIVETARGLEFGYVSAENRMVHNREIVQPLKNVVRIATEEDEKHREENEQKEIEAFNTCLVKIEERKLEMKLVEVEYTFDNSKLLFYFTADGRVDFRDLVKDLATIFRTRIELRQIGIRDEAKMMGGLGICGRPFCCKSFLPDFVQVSIKMAKEQNLSLNSAKISGACGRLMCCLRYEYDTYIAESALTPKVDSIVSTPDGDGVVVETSPLAGLVKVSLKKAPDQPPQLYHRDNIKVKGNVKKDSEREETKTEDDNNSTEPDGDKL